MTNDNEAYVPRDNPEENQSPIEKSEVFSIQSRILKLIKWLAAILIVIIVLAGLISLWGYVLR